MNFSRIGCGATVLLLSWLAAGACAADDGIEQLRAENARLRAQLQQLQQSCPAATAAPVGKTAAPVAVAPAAVQAPALTTALAPLASQPPAGVGAVQTPSATAAPAPVAAVAVPAGYKLVPVNAPDYVDPLAPPYDRTGCSRDLFKGPPPARWNEADNWLDLEKGQDMAAVEKSLGKEHFDRSGKGLVEWQYGKCADQVAGRVLFQDGKVVSWHTPDLR